MVIVLIEKSAAIYIIIKNLFFDYIFRLSLTSILSKIGHVWIILISPYSMHFWADNATMTLFDVVMVTDDDQAPVIVWPSAVQPEGLFIFTNEKLRICNEGRPGIFPVMYHFKIITLKFYWKWFLMYNTLIWPWNRLSLKNKTGYPWANKGEKMETIN